MDLAEEMHLRFSPDDAPYVFCFPCIILLLKTWNMFICSVLNTDVMASFYRVEMETPIFHFL